MTTSATVTQYFNNVLQRDPSASELSSFVAVIDSGALTAEQVLESIVNSSEAQTFAAQVVRFYQAAFGRVPDVTGINGWVDDIVSGAKTTTDLAVGFVLSPEWTARYGSTEVNSATLTGLYQNVLGRVPSGDEIDAWIATGQSLDQVFIGFANSAEFQNNATAAVNALLTTAGNTATADIATVYNGTTPLPVGASGEIFILTENADNIMGTSGGDTIQAPSLLQAGASVPTLNPLDTIDGAGGNDTLIIDNTVSGGGGQNILQGTITNVENATFLGAGNVNGGAAIDTSIFSAEIKLQQTSDGNVNFTNVAGHTIIADRVADNDILDIDMVAAQTSVNLQTMSPVGTVEFNVDGAALTTVNLAVDGTNTGDTVLVEDTNGASGDDTIKNVAITASGSTGSNVTVNSTVLEGVTTSGDGAVTLNMSNPASKTIDASANKGGTTVATTLANTTAFTGGEGKDTVTVGANTAAQSMGAGDDTVNLTGAALGALGSADGGAGTDTLGMTSANAATASAATTFEGTISNFEEVSLGATAGGANDTVNLANLDDISMVKTAGTAAATGTAEVQTVTVTGAADATGGSVTFAGVDFTLANNATTTAIATQIAAQQAAIIAANPNIVSVTSAGAVITVTYNTTSGDAAALSYADNSSGATFGGVATSVAGTTEVTEVQTLQSTAGVPTASGLVTINVNGTNVQANLIKGQTDTQVATTIAAAITAASVANVASATSVGDTVTITFSSTGAADPAQVTFTDTATTGAAATPATTVAHVAPVAESQTFTVTAGTDANGGEILVNGARIALGANLTVDQVGTAIAAAEATIKAADANVSTVAYNTGTDTVTVSYTLAAGNVGLGTVVDNASGSTVAVVETTKGIAGTAGGILNITNMTTGGTLEQTGAINGASSVAITDALTNGADIFNLKLNGASNIVNTAALTVANVETINIEATDSTTATDPTAPSTVILNATAATSVVISGNHGVNTTGSTLSGVTSFDASGVTGTGAAGATTFATSTTNKDVTIKGGAGDDVLSGASTTDATKVITIEGNDGNDTITGGAGKDVLSGGAGNDILTGGASADALTTGAGNDIINITTVTDSTLAARDVVSDFSANTFGNGAGGAAGTGAGAAANRTGDVVQIDVAAAQVAAGTVISAQANAADAQTFIQNVAANGTPNQVGAALDSSTGFLYLDVDSNGTIDSVIELSGVTTIDAAAILLV